MSDESCECLFNWCAKNISSENIARQLAMHLGVSQRFQEEMYETHQNYLVSAHNAFATLRFHDSEAFAMGNLINKLEYYFEKINSA